MLKVFLQSLRNSFSRTIRRQLIIGVAVVHAAMMALFVWDLTERQRDLLLDRQTEQAKALVSSVATSAAGWVASRDLNGLQEIVTAQARYPELLFAMILGKDGRVLAHSDTTFLGHYLKDLPSEPVVTVLTRTPSLVDAVSPVILADRVVGWVRVGLGQEETADRMAAITRDGVLYAIIAIFIGSVLAWFIGTKLTRKLHAIQLSADAIEQGNSFHRVAVEGNDEVTHLAHAFNKMLDSMESSRLELESSEEKYRMAMGAAQDGMWDWDVVTGNVHYSPGWGRIVGEEMVENNYGSWEKRIHQDDKERILESLQDHLAGKTEVWQEEHRLQKSDGSWAWVLGRGQVVKKNEDQNPLRMIGTMSDVTNKKENEEIIWQQANYDNLTHLPNRKLFHELLDQEIKQMHRDKQQLWVLFLDLDGFKEVNDTLGHDNGDALLILVAERIRSILREADIVARLGGDEFVVVLSQTVELNYVDEIASHLIEVLGESYKLANDDVHITASIGIANYPNDADNVTDLMKFADQSMYAAKKEGKNRYSYFTPALQKASLVRNQISSDLRRAIVRDEFALHYQPIINLENNEVLKAEALIRWMHPEKGLISPASFIPIAEDTGVICEIGSWVFDHSFKQLQQWKTHIDNTFQMSINMSPFQLKVTESKYDNWLDRLKNYDLSGENIVVEITEGLLLKKQELVNKRLLQYRDAGVQVAIDDFGTGYSSLSYLKEFDIDYLKIDQSFTRNLEPGSNEESLSEAIVVMAHKLGLKVIAEGIETEQQLNMLKAMGCDYGQGYFFSRPLPAGEFERAYIR